MHRYRVLCNMEVHLAFQKEHPQSLASLPGCRRPSKKNVEPATRLRSPLHWFHDDMAFSNMMYSAQPWGSKDVAGSSPPQSHPRRFIAQWFLACRHDREMRDRWDGTSWTNSASIRWLLVLVFAGSQATYTQKSAFPGASHYILYSI